MSKYPHLMNRNGNYYFRIAVPSSLICKLGRKELTYSLKTKCRNLAKSRVSFLTQRACDFFVKAKVMPMDVEEFRKALLTAYANKLVNDPNYIDIATGAALSSEWKPILRRALKCTQG